MTEDDKWERLTITLSESAPNIGLKVGCALVEDNSRLIAFSYENEIDGLEWHEILLLKLKNVHAHGLLTLYVTINNLSKQGNFGLSNVLGIFPIKRVVIGMPDPSLSSIREDDPIYSMVPFSRYSDKLKEVILQINLTAYTKSRCWIKNSFFEKKRIQELVKDNLSKRGYDTSTILTDFSHNYETLVNSLSTNDDMQQNMQNDVLESISQAFNFKYGIAGELKDAREFDNSDSWIDAVKRATSLSLDNNHSIPHILNVGVGNGKEALTLFDSQFGGTFIDIAPSGLERIKHHFKNASYYVCSANNLPENLSESYDIYLSLRTFNSAYFDVIHAIKEAYRVLKHHGTLIISIANAFVDEQDNTVIPGLLLPGTKFIDIYRGREITNELSYVLGENGFYSVVETVVPTEIFITARKDAPFLGKETRQSTVGKNIQYYIKQISTLGPSLPDPYKLINPYTVPPSDDMWSAIDSFYRHYYDDTDSRILIIGSNPSRSRSAVSGIPYEDPVKEDIGTNPNDTHTTGKKNFLQDVIDELGGKKLFYRKYYMGFFFPFGIERTSPQKRPTNANYYEDRALLEATKPISQKSLEYLLKTGVRDDICFCLGKGKHFECMHSLNAEYHYFQQIVPLEHPRYITQYHREQTEYFRSKYITELKKYM